MAELIQIQLRFGTAAEWDTANTVLLEGEPGWDSTNCILKIGDGVTPWKTLKAPSGGGNDVIVGKPAGEIINAGRAVIIDNDQVFLFDHTDPTHYNRVIGVSTNAATIIGDPVIIVTDNNFVPALTLINGAQYFAITGGVLTTTPPTNSGDIVQPIGTAISVNELSLNIEQPLILA